MKKENQTRRDNVVKFEEEWKGKLESLPVEEQQKLALFEAACEAEDVATIYKDFPDVESIQESALLELVLEKLEERIIDKGLIEEYQVYREANWGL